MTSHVSAKDIDYDRQQIDAFQLHAHMNATL